MHIEICVKAMKVKKKPDFASNGQLTVASTNVYGYRYGAMVINSLLTKIGWFSFNSEWLTMLRMYITG